MGRDRGNNCGMSHREQVKHFHEPGCPQELTCSSYRRQPLLTNDDWRAKLAEALDQAGRTEQFNLHPSFFPR